MAQQGATWGVFLSKTNYGIARCLWGLAGDLDGKREVFFTTQRNLDCTIRRVRAFDHGPGGLNAGLERVIEWSFIDE